MHSLVTFSIVLLSTVGLACTNEVVAAGEVISILFAGDTSYGENYQEGYAAAGRENIIASRGYDYSIAGLKGLLAACDLNILNLETPLTSLKKSPLVGKEPCHYSHPTDATAAMHKHRVHVVSLANNHAMDFGSAGLDETLESLQRAGIESFGAGQDERSAGAPYIKEFSLAGQQFRIAVIGAFEYRKAYKPYDFYARGDKPGASQIDVDRIAQQIMELRKQYDDLFIVIFPHWGENYVWRSKKLQTLGRKFVDAGADLVVGHGAHCIQEIEKYRGRWIFYSIGNFMFNSEGRYAKLKAPPYSMPLVLHVSATDGHLSKTLRAYPIVSDNRLTDYQPRLVNPKELEEVRTLLVQHSTDADLKKEMTVRSDAVGSAFELSAD